MSLITNLNCAECGEKIEMRVYKEVSGCTKFKNIELNAEIERQYCDCEISGFDLDELCEEAIENLREDF
jgi:hypothetical protein